MTTENTQQASALSGLSSLRRWLLAAVGVFFFGVGALGVFVPGMPTTIFLILASWCFTRSCPWLERKLIQTPLFRPFQAYLQPDAVMPRRARILALVVCCLGLLKIPLGTALGVYGLVILTREEAAALFAARPLPPETR